MKSPTPWKVAQVEVLEGFVLRVTFGDGVCGTVDMKPLLARPDLVGTVFEPLRDPVYFGRASLDHGAVTWPNGADLAPDAMRNAIVAQGIWQPA